jgi:hypothetical protein
MFKEPIPNKLRNFARIKSQMVLCFVFQSNHFLINICYLLLIFFVVACKREDGSDVTQGKMFIETCTSQKEKEVDRDTQNVIVINYRCK